MDRVPEPELMLGVEQALAYAYADFAEPHSRFVTLLKERFPNLPSSGRVLDLGSGPGDISCRLARAFPAWKIDAVDGSPAMLELGRRRVVEAGLTSRVQFHELILPVDKLPHDSYVLVFSNSLLHHLRDPMVLWSTVRRQQPATDVFVMDLLRPSSQSETDALVDQYAKDEPEILQTDFFNSLLAAYETVEVESQLKSVDLGHLNLEVVSDRHFIVWGRIV
ncbi:MAG: class I SAM-dependent methyltransferase [Planctomycetes bacterium]|nr:class I SAM-dependent methyltransferase [Planctomycetota bacterium]